MSSVLPTVHVHVLMLLFICLQLRLPAFSDQSAMSTHHGTSLAKSTTTTSAGRIVGSIVTSHTGSDGNVVPVISNPRTMTSRAPNEINTPVERKTRIFTSRAQRHMNTPGEWSPRIVAVRTLCDESVTGSGTNTVQVPDSTRPSIPRTEHTRKTYHKKYTKTFPKPRSRHKCDVCGKVYLNRQNFSAHRRVVHDIQMPLYFHPRTEHPDAKFSCHICSRKFLNRCSVGSHLRIVHGVHSLQRSARQGHPDAKYSCNICGRKFLTNSIVNHKALVHGVSDVRNVRSALRSSKKTTV